jgi:hypothetical protein
MLLADKITALFMVLKREEVDALPPAARERFAQTCRYWAEFCERRPEPARSGVLVELARRRRDE